MYFRFAIYFVLDFTVNLVGYCLNPFLPLFADSKGNLPASLRWFQTYDSTLDGQEPRFIDATSWLRDDTGTPKNALCRLLCRVCWIYRNNAYGFAYSILGAPLPLVVLFEEGVNPADRAPAIEGEYLIKYDGYFQYKFVKDRGNGKCYEASIGWKPSGQFVCRWTPFRTFNG